MSTNTATTVSANEVQKLLKEYISKLVESKDITAENCYKHARSIAINNFLKANPQFSRGIVLVTYSTVIKELFPNVEQPKTTSTCPLTSSEAAVEKEPRPTRKHKCYCTPQKAKQPKRPTTEQDVIRNLEHEGANIIRFTKPEIENIITIITERINQPQIDEETKNDIISEIMSMRRRKIIKSKTSRNLINNLIRKMNKFTPCEEFNMHHDKDSFTEWCEKMYVINELNPEDDSIVALPSYTNENKLSELFQIYQIQHPEHELSMEDFKYYLQCFFKNDVTTHFIPKDDDEYSFITVLKERYPNADDSKLNSMHLSHNTALSADRWSEFPIRKIGSVAVGEYGCIVTDSDHYTWCPLMEQSRYQWMKHIGSDTFVKVSFNSRYSRAMEINYKHMIDDQTFGIDECIKGVKHSTSLAELLYWVDELHECCRINGDTYPRLDLSRVGGFNWETKEECQHIIELMSILYRLHNNEDYICDYSHDERNRSSLKNIDEYDYDTVKTVYLIETEKKHDVYIEYKDDVSTEDDYNNLMCSIAVKDETPDDWKYFVNACEMPKREAYTWCYNPQRKSKDKYAVDSRLFIPNVSRLTGINLLNLEIVYKYIQLTDEKRIPNNLWIELDPEHFEKE